MVNTKDYINYDKLEAMTNEEIEAYCFLPGNKTKWQDDALAEINDNLEKYPYLKTLSGTPLGYVLKKIENNLLTWFPDDKKLNPKILYTLQSILITNIDELKKSAITAHANVFLSDSIIKLNTTIGRPIMDKTNQTNI